MVSSFVAFRLIVVWEGPERFLGLFAPFRLGPCKIVIHRFQAYSSEKGQIVLLGVFRSKLGKWKPAISKAFHLRDEFSHDHL